MQATRAMTRAVICITPEDTLEDAHAIMTEWQIRHLPVVEAGKLVGILSDRDVLTEASRSDGVLRVPQVEVSRVMTRDVVTCVAASSIAHIAHLMLEHKIDCVPVLDSMDHVVGLVTSTDLIEILRDREQAEARVLPFRYTVHHDVRRARTS